MKKSIMVVGTMMLASLAVVGKRTYDAIKTQKAAKDNAIEIPVEETKEDTRG